MAAGRQDSSEAAVDRRGQRCRTGGNERTDGVEGCLGADHIGLKIPQVGV